MAKFPLYQWKKAGGGSSSIDTTNLAKTNEANTFTAENTFTANIRVENGNTAGIYTAKDITNDNDNQVVNYKAYYWKKIHEQNSFRLAATNGVNAYDITTTDLVRYKNLNIMLRFTPSNYDYTVVFNLTCNNLSYKNQGDIRFIHWADNTLTTLDITNLICVSVAQYGGNKLRVIVRNLATNAIDTGKIYTYIQMVKPNFQR